MFFANFKKPYVNPYRSGVKIGNYNEDLFGKEIGDKYKDIDYNKPNVYKNYISENMDQYKWPEINKKLLKMPGNGITETHNSNFDLNIVFNKQNFDDYMKIYQRNEQNPFILEDKNQFSKDQFQVKENINANNKNLQERPKSVNVSQIKSTQKKKTFYDDGPYQDANEQIIDQTQKILGKTQVKDANGLFNNKEIGINNYLLMGHGCQKNFLKSEYSSMYDLTISRKEKTDKVLDPKYHIDKNFQHYPPYGADFTDWGYRKYKIIGDAARKFDKKTNEIPYS